MNRIRIGHAGCGSVSLRGILPHLTAEDMHDIVELVAVCDIDGERAKAVAKQFGAAHSYDSFEEMVNSDDLDLIVIATPISLHAAQAEMALRSGKHVFMNKTMAVNLEEADRVMKAAEESGMQFVSAPGQMHAPVLAKLRGMMKNGDFGRMYWGFAHQSWSGQTAETYDSAGHVIQRDPTWFYKKPGGGTMYDLAVYQLHNVTGLLGPVRSVTAMSGIVQEKRIVSGKSIDVEMDDNTWLLLDFGGSCTVMLGAAFSYDAHYLHGGLLGLFGSDGGIEVVRTDPLSGWPAEIHILRGGEKEIIQADNNQHPLLQGIHGTIQEPHIFVDIMELIDCIRTGNKPVASLEHARHVVEVIDKGYISAQTGQRQYMTTTF
jgi:predicted dehydrogenase